MTVPKGFRKNINIHQSKIGPDRRQEMLDDINYKGTYLPNSVEYEDMDQSFINFVKNQINFIIEGRSIPVIFLTIQRWSEFTKTWDFSNEFKDIDVPFITIVRKPDIQKGTNQQGLWNVAGKPTFTYIKVPTNYADRKGYDLYKIPQPVSVDLIYEVRIFCNKMRQVNDFNLKMQQFFRSRQHYISPNEHPMPLHLENIADESNIDDFENRRFYVQLFEILLKGYVVDENEFEIIPTIDRTVLFSEIVDDISPKPKLKISSDEGNNTIYTIIVKPLALSEFTTKLKYNTRFKTIEIFENVNSIEFKLNNNPVTLPFTANAGDTLFIKINRNINKISKLKIYGNLI